MLAFIINVIDRSNLIVYWNNSLEKKTKLRVDFKNTLSICMALIGALSPHLSVLHYSIPQNLENNFCRQDHTKCNSVRSAFIRLNARKSSEY